MNIKELEQVVKDEILQRKEEGHDVAGIERRFTETKKRTVSRLQRFWKELEKSTSKADFRYREPMDLESIRAESPKGPSKIEVTLSDSELYDKIYGAWLGRCTGNQLGKPVEGLSKEQIETWLKVAGAYPLSNYFPPIPKMPDDAPEWLKKRLANSEQAFKKTKKGTLLGQLKGTVRDDDIDYTILGLYILETYGPDFTTMNVGEAWLDLLPYRKIYTAERAAYRNLVNGLVPLESATYMNPYREWIGAQIRADIWGFVTPGMLEKGAELAYRDACLSHIKNGTYGEMFVSAMISAAFTTDSLDKIIEAGLAVIPKKCRLTEAIKNTVAWCNKYADWKDTWNKIIEKYGHYHHVHTINNAAIVVMGLLYGKGDLEKSIAISVMGGLDTDCNGATAGSIVGVMLGAKALPEKWTNPLEDSMESFVIGYNNSRISDIAGRTQVVANKFLGK